MKILFLHHFESYWEDKLNLSGTSIAKEKYKVLRHMKKNKFGKVIITKNKDVSFELDYLEILEYCLKNNIKFNIHQYGCGTIKKEKYNQKNINSTWCYGKRAYHDEDDILLIKKWMHRLKPSYVHLGGCFEKECVLDMETIFRTINVRYEKIKDLVVS